DIDYKGEESIHINYLINEFKDKRDYAVGLSILVSLCSDFEMEPDLGIEDFEDIITKVKSKNKEAFTVEIYQDGLEIDL
ncbi:hypothetical protein N9B72_00725, partial [Bacteriovoracaceae bacterium]|nr:hypothetical protein [Bacteriovoracaceae bacterium]